MGNEDLPFRGTVRSVGWGIFVMDGSSGQGTEMLPSVSPTIDWVRLPQRFPVRIQVDSSARTELRIGQTASVAVSHGASKTPSRIKENFNASTLPEDAMKEISEGIKTPQRFNAVAETGVPGFIPRGK